jgi:hypothetical protein
VRDFSNHFTEVHENIPPVISRVRQGIKAAPHPSFAPGADSECNGLYIRNDILDLYRFIDRMGLIKSPGPEHDSGNLALIDEMSAVIGPCARHDFHLSPECPFP